MAVGRSIFNVLIWRRMLMFVVMTGRWGWFYPCWCGSVEMICHEIITFRLSVNSSLWPVGDTVKVVVWDGNIAEIGDIVKGCWEGRIHLRKKGWVNKLNTRSCQVYLFLLLLFKVFIMSKVITVVNATRIGIVFHRVAPSTCLYSAAAAAAAARKKTSASGTTGKPSGTGQLIWRVLCVSNAQWTQRLINSPPHWTVKQNFKPFSHYRHCFILELKRF